MKKGTIYICDFEEEDYELVAIYSVLQDYKLAYKINEKLGFNFSRMAPDLDLEINENDKAYFSAFVFHENKSFINWHLIKNKFQIQNKEVVLDGLFSSESLYKSSYVYLQPELKEVDYLLKIEGDFNQEIIEDTIKEINKIDGVITSRIVEKDKLNHKEHLIF